MRSPTWTGLPIRVHKIPRNVDCVGGPHVVVDGRLRSVFNAGFHVLLSEERTRDAMRICEPSYSVGAD